MKRLALAALALGAGRLLYSAFRAAFVVTAEAHAAAERAERATAEAVQSAEACDRARADLEGAAEGLDDAYGRAMAAEQRMVQAEHDLTERLIVQVERNNQSAQSLNAAVTELDAVRRAVAVETLGAIR